MPGLPPDDTAFCSISAEMLQKAAEAALIGEQLPARQRAALAGAARTVGLLQMLKAAAEAACTEQHVVVALCTHEPKLTFSAKVAMVCIRLLGLEEQQGVAAMENLGKRILKEVKQAENMLKKTKESMRIKVVTLRRRWRDEDGDEAALAAQVESCSADGEAAMLALQGKIASSVSQAPASSRVKQRQLQQEEPCESTRSGTGVRDAAASLAALSQREWSCSRCAELLEEAIEARRARDAALETARTATQLREMAERAKADARAEAERRCSELAEVHALEVGELQSALVSAKRDKCTAGKEARQEAEAKRKEAARARGHQETAVINHVHTFRELEAAREALAKAEAGAAKRLGDEQKARQAVEAKFSEWHGTQLAAHRSVEQKLCVANRRIADLEAIEGTLKLEVGDLESQLTSERVKRGLAEKKAAQHAQPESNGRRDGGGSSERSDKNMLLKTVELLRSHICDRDAALKEAQQARERAEQQRLHLDGELRDLRRQRGGDAEQSGPAPSSDVRIFTARDIRRKRTARGWLEPFTMEYLRRLVEETNMSFSAVPKAIALIWSMLILEPIPEDFLLSAYSAAQAFLRLEHLDAADAAARQRQADSHWGFAADGGNKGIALNLIAISAWDSVRCVPFMEPLACVPLDGDQSARNGADTVNAAIAASGLNPAKCQQGMSDGADAATQETERVLKEQHRRAVEAAKQPRVQPAPPQQQQQQPQQDADAQEGPRLRRPPQPERALGEPPRTSTGESCCIHANALVERAFLDEAFPLLIDATRMMWEIFKGEDNRLEQYRYIWGMVKNPALSPDMFNTAIARVRARTSGPVRVAFCALAKGVLFACSVRE